MESESSLNEEWMSFLSNSTEYKKGMPREPEKKIENDV